MAISIVAAHGVKAVGCQALPARFRPGEKAVRSRNPPDTRLWRAEIIPDVCGEFDDRIMVNGKWSMVKVNEKRDQ